MKYIVWFLAALPILPVSAFAFYKPVRLLLPEAFGVECERRVCIDDLAQWNAAVTLLAIAKHHLEIPQGLSVDEPKIVFCRTKRCEQTFGLAQRASYTFGTIGIAIAARGWKEHYVAHELIHYWQAENFGSLVLINGEPWLIEGMAYALSNDPRTKLHEPFEAYRKRFNDWHRLNTGVPLTKSVGEAL